MPNFIKIKTFTTAEEKKELRYHLKNHRFFHKPVKVIIKIYDSKSKNHIGMEHSIKDVIRIDWTQGFKNRYVVITTSKYEGSNIYHLFKNAIYVEAVKCGRIIPE